MSVFINSMIRQVGRDMGKVVSNKVFKDSHSSPYRRVGNNTSTNTFKKNKDDFYSFIQFPITNSPPTLLQKIIASYVLLKKEFQLILEDDFLEWDEIQDMMNILNLFILKFTEIHDIVTLNQMKIDKLDNIGNEFVQHTKSFIDRCLLLVSEDIKVFKEELEKTTYNFIKKKRIKKNLAISQEKIHLLKQINQQIKL